MNKKDLKNITLTTSQEKILQHLLDFVNDTSSRVFILKGYAGTGKTTLMRFLIQKLKEQEKSFALMASTGRASKILSNLTNGKAVTIHSTIYHYNGLNKEFDDKEEIKIGKDGQLFLLFEQTTIDEDCDPETIYIIDEASMVADVASKDITQAKYGSGRLLKELLEYDSRPQSKFIFVGDPCQLPPITQYISPALSREYFEKFFNIQPEEAQLTEIMRQDETNDIIDASKQIRKRYNQAPESPLFYGRQKLWGKLPFRNCSNIVFHPNLSDLINDYVQSVQSRGINSAIFICRSNKSCHETSAVIRPKLNIIDKRIQKDDLLIVIQNNFPTGLMNGDMVIITDMSSQTITRATLTFRQVKVKELFTTREFSALLMEDTIYMNRLNLGSDQQQELFVDFIKRMRKRGISQKHDKEAFNKALQNDPYLNALRCSFGYALTCHKAQGGEWNDVYLNVPRNIMLNPTKETYQWIYTAMTRASERRHIIDDIYIEGYDNARRML